MAVFDLAPASWLGLAMVWGSAGTACVLLVRWARSPGWSAPHLVAFAFGAILERTVVGFLVPTPPGGDPVGKVVQNVVVLLLVLGLGWLLRVRARETRDTRHNEPGDRAIPTSPPR
jgi:hypothetical protein